MYMSTNRTPNPGEQARKDRLSDSAAERARLEETKTRNKQANEAARKAAAAEHVAERERETEERIAQLRDDLKHRFESGEAVTFSEEIPQEDNDPSIVTDDSAEASDDSTYPTPGQRSQERIGHRKNALQQPENRWYNSIREKRRTDTTMFKKPWYVMRGGPRRDFKNSLGPAEQFADKFRSFTVRDIPLPSISRISFNQEDRKNNKYEAFARPNRLENIQRYEEVATVIERMLAAIHSYTVARYQTMHPALKQSQYPNFQPDILTPLIAVPLTSQKETARRLLAPSIDRPKATRADVYTYIQDTLSREAVETIILKIEQSIQRERRPTIPPEGEALYNELLSLLDTLPRQEESVPSAAA